MSAILDAANEIRELDAKGLGRNKIAMITGIPSSTVRNILDGDNNVEYTGKLTPRQIAKLFRTWLPVQES